MSKFIRSAASILSLASVLVAAQAHADMASGTTKAVNLYPAWGWAEAAQSFKAPSSDTILSQWSFSLDGSGTNYRFSIVQLDGGMPDLTQPLFSVTQAWSTGTQTISNINLGLTGGAQYAAVIDFLGYTNVSVYYVDDDYVDGNAYWGATSGGSDWISSPEVDLYFSAAFVSANSVPEPASAALLGLGLTAAMWRRRRQS